MLDVTVRNLRAGSPACLSRAVMTKGRALTDSGVTARNRLGGVRVDSVRVLG